MSFLTSILVPSPKLFRAGAVLINARGERFLDELDSPSDTLHAGARRGSRKNSRTCCSTASSRRNSRAWPNYVSTAPGFAYAFVPDYRRTRKDIFHEAPTLEALARKLGMPAGDAEENRGRLQRVAGIARPGGGTPAARPRTVHRHGARCGTISISATAAWRSIPGCACSGREDKPIPGLFAAGFIGMGGMLLEGHGHHIGWAFTSGRLAGRHAAYRVVSEELEGEHAEMRRDQMFRSLDTKAR